jgi:hypothetical protein
MKTLISHLLIFPILFLMIAAATSSIDKSIVGSWSFTANSAPGSITAEQSYLKKMKMPLKEKSFSHRQRSCD